MSGFLDKAYGISTTEETRELYDDWADSYDRELTSQGYATPRRIAEALARHVPLNAPVLDMGCGTGLSGMALENAGFATIDGADLSEEMLEEAKAKGIYRALREVDPDDPLGPVSPGDYAAIVACGVIGAGAAPLSLFDQCMHALAPSGHFAFSFNDHALADPAYEEKVVEWSDHAEVVHDAEGEHIPGIGLRSRVWVMRKM